MAQMNLLLRKARKRRLWTIQRTATMVGVSFQTYIRWELGTQTPHLSSLGMLCSTFEAKPDDLGFGQLIDGSEPRESESA